MFITGDEPPQRTVAGTIIQFVDFGGKLLGGVVDIYCSANGSLDVNNEIELVATDLKELVVKLRGARFEGTVNDTHNPLGGFKALCERLAMVTDEITAKLEVEKWKTSHRCSRYQTSAIFDKLDSTLQHTISAILAVQTQSTTTTTQVFCRGMNDMMRAMAQRLRRVESGKHASRHLDVHICDGIRE
jgi:hypothetical protein